MIWTLGPNIRMSLWTIASASLFVGGGIDPFEPARAEAPVAPAPIDKTQPHDPAACEVTVIDAETKQPLPGATVSARIDFKHVDFQTDASGRARIALAGRKFGKGTLTFNAWDYGHVPQERSFTNFDPRKEPIPDRLTVALWPGSETIGGKVVDEEGRPVAGANVRLRGALDERKDPSESFAIHVTTDAQGRWQTGGAQRLKSVELAIEHPDFVSDVWSTDRKIEAPMDALRAGRDVQVMKRGHVVEGRVVDDQGRPIAGASVHWSPSGRLFNMAQCLKSTTGADGRFRFANVKPGNGPFLPFVVLIARAPGHEPGVANVLLRPGLAPVEFRLGPGKTLAGRVVDDQGKPVDGALVSVRSWREYRCLGVYLSTGADGWFCWDGAPADDVAISINLSERGYLPVFNQRITPGARDAVCTLKPGLMVTGTVRDAATGAKIAFDPVERGVTDPKSEKTTWTRAEDLGVSDLLLRADGFLRADFDSSAAPAYRLRVSAAGYTPTVSPEFPSNAGRITWDVQLEPIERTAAREDVHRQ